MKLALTLKQIKLASKQQPIELTIEQIDQIYFTNKDIPYFPRGSIDSVLDSLFDTFPQYENFLIRSEYDLLVISMYSGLQKKTTTYQKVYL